jgi:hypothetical protein
MAIYIYTLLLILLGNIIGLLGVRADSSIFWLIIFIILGLFLSYDLMTNCNYEEKLKDQKDKEDPK